jgi:hypothetical protein
LIDGGRGMAKLAWFWDLFEGVRRIVVFLLGVIIIIFALIDPESANTIVMLLIGMVMVGILPIENLMLWFPGRRKDREKENGK